MGNFFTKLLAVGEEHTDESFVAGKFEILGGNCDFPSAFNISYFSTKIKLIGLHGSF